MLLLYILNQTSIKSLSQDLLQSLKTKKKKTILFLWIGFKESIRIL